MVSAGGQDTGDGSFDIKVPGLYETIEDVLNTPVKTNGDSVITFRDIAISLKVITESPLVLTGVFNTSSIVSYKPGTLISKLPSPVS